jgi:predicted acylesterase/phospholipase RssA
MNTLQLLITPLISPSLDQVSAIAINKRQENRRRSREWTIQTLETFGTQGTGRTKHTTQKTTKMSNMDHTQNRG